VCLTRAECSNEAHNEAASPAEQHGCTGRHMGAANDAMPAALALATSGRPRLQLLPGQPAQRRPVRCLN
jgi:hypothetical protein